MDAKKILMIAPKTDTFVNFRGDLIRDIRKKGYDVTVVIPEDDCKKFFKENGVKTRLINLDKNSTSVLNTLAYYRDLKTIIAEEHPDKVFSYTIKPVIFGSLAAHSVGVKEIYSLICGLGLLFSSYSMKIRALRAICGVLYKRALKHNSKVIFQNQDDIDEFIKRKYVKKSQCELVNGSGVNLEKFKRNKLPRNISFIMVSRVLKEKGVLEYFEAAKIVKEKYPEVHFTYIGAIDKNKNAINLEMLEPYIKEKIVEYVPETKKVEEYLAKSSVFVLPSYYREGIPKTLLEATAMGRPIITTNTPGCKETVIEKKNGLFVKTRSIDDLSNKIIYVIKHKDSLQKMGDASYAICLEKFTIGAINNRMKQIMRI
ncbi:glycosyltransferase family 4 protein [Candidatus Saccharibacteria bacterium]|nr:glycosyltransferase family 4 protein [Candidatus Saccharibacteria bacterium]